MTYIEAFNKINKAIKSTRKIKIDGHFAAQINLNDSDANGIFYIEVKDNKLFVEPYDYYDNDAVFTVFTDDFIDIMTGKVDFDKALSEGIISFEGNPERAALIKQIIKKPTAKKTTAKKPTAKKTESK